MKKYKLYIIAFLFIGVGLFAINTQKEDINNETINTSTQQNIEKDLGVEFVDRKNGDDQMVEKIVEGEAVKEPIIEYEASEKRKVEIKNGLDWYLAFKEFNCNDIQSRSSHNDSEKEEIFVDDKLSFCKKFFNKESISVHDFEVKIESINGSFKIPECSQVEVEHNGTVDFEGISERFALTGSHKKITVYLSGDIENDRMNDFYIINNTQNLSTEDMHALTSCEEYYLVGWYVKPIVLDDYIIIGSRVPGMGVSECWGVDGKPSISGEELIKCVILEEKSNDINLILE